MRNRDDEEFELVLGNKQLISLFFLVVVLFAVFFLFGYTVGLRRGGDEILMAEASTLASVDQPESAQPAAPPASSPAPAVSTPAAAPPPAKTTPPPAANPPKPTPAKTAAAAPPKAAPPKAAPPRPAPAKTAPPAARKSAARPAPSGGTGSAVGSAIHLQIAAFREAGDADMLVDELTKKGHKAVVFNRGDEWRRVVIGPFPNVAAAKTYQQRLSGEGLESLLRRP